MVIPTYIINLKSRPDRRENVLKEFESKSEFDITIVDAIKHDVGAIGLWSTINHIIGTLAGSSDFFLVCEDDHQFTENYSLEILNRCLEEAIAKEANILCGGVSWFEDGYPVSNNLFWVKKFSGLQFTFIFKGFYSKILSSNFNQYDAADYKISDLASRKYFIHPFISAQKEFGYSDVTSKNHQTERVEELFSTTERNAASIRRTVSFYKSIPNIAEANSQVDFETVTIPTYIINLAERKERKKHISDQLIGKKEFDVTVVNACKHTIGAVGLWQSIRKVIGMAIDNNDDVIIICEDDHEFTYNYNKEFLFKNIIQAHEQGCDYLNCGTGKFDFAIPISTNRLWVNHCLSTQFIVLYRKFFQRILDESYDDTIAADLKLSEMTNHKMILYPFISFQHDFGYSDVTEIHNQQKNLVKDMFSLSESRLDAISKAMTDHKTFSL